MIREKLEHNIRTVKLLVDKKLLGWEVWIDDTKYPKFYNDLYDTKDEWQAVKAALLENADVTKHRAENNG